MADSMENVVNKEQGLEIFSGADRRRRRARPALTHKEAAREIPVFAESDVLVIGGGPAGTSAAIAAGRLGADVMLVERYNHLGGLSTGGLVIWIDRMSDWSGEQMQGEPDFLFKDHLHRQGLKRLGVDRRRPGYDAVVCRCSLRPIGRGSDILRPPRISRRPEDCVLWQTLEDFLRKTCYHYRTQYDARRDLRE